MRRLLVSVLLAVVAACASHGTAPAQEDKIKELNDTVEKLRKYNKDLVNDKKKLEEENAKLKKENDELRKGGKAEGDKPAKVDLAQPGSKWAGTIVTKDRNGKVIFSKDLVMLVKKRDGQDIVFEFQMDKGAAILEVQGKIDNSGGVTGAPQVALKGNFAPGVIGQKISYGRIAGKAWEGTRVDKEGVQRTIKCKLEEE